MDKKMKEILEGKELVIASLSDEHKEILEGVCETHYDLEKPDIPKNILERYGDMDCLNFNDFRACSIIQEKIDKNHGAGNFLAYKDGWGYRYVFVVSTGYWIMYSGSLRKAKNRVTALNKRFREELKSPT